jgi:glycosyltransferase involved in cell wall biosynthesis
MKILMICQDVRIDRRIVLQAQTLVTGGYEAAILARAEPEAVVSGQWSVVSGRRQTPTTTPASGYPQPLATEDGIPVRRIRVEGRDPRLRWLFRLTTLTGRATYVGAVTAAKLWGAVSANNTFNVLALPAAIRAGADVYHAHDLINLPVAYRAARARGAKLAYDAHELFSEISNPWIRVRRGYWRRTEKRLLPACLLATTVNEFIAQEMAKRYGVPPPEVIYNCPQAPEGFDPEAAARAGHLHKALDLPAEVRVLLYQGWLGEGRGLEEMIRGAGRLRGANTVLALMGYGDYRLGLEAVASRGGLNHYFSSPNKLFDFIQARLPILANDLPFLRKVIAGRDIGMVAPMTSPDSVGEAMLGILSKLDDADTASRWRRNLTEAAQVYNWEHEGEKLLGLFYQRVGRPMRKT